ncbi:MAG TPA: FAD-dependent monooxygenase [Longimicrobiales bacterium]|nr:FAD-dependent monooxygenase [Longimicrobiales bacterium]
MERDPSVHDVVVVGGGPGGASAAALLARRGCDVALLTRVSPPASALAESIPPSARGLLDRVGVLEHLDGSGLHANGGNTVWWAEGRERSESFAPDSGGFQAERGRLEEIFAEHARDEGARVLRGRAVRRIRREDLRGGPPLWRIDRPDAPSLRARWVLDATGRAGLMAKPALREPDERTPTLALVRRWRVPESVVGTRGTHTLVESYPDGWAWSVPLASTERCVTAMVDPRRTGLRRAAGLSAMYDAEIAKTHHLRRILADAAPAGDAWACPASLYTARSFGGPGFLLVGDAGSFIDPLSSYGVKKALASGWLAAVVVGTALEQPWMEEAARAFHDARERLVYRSYRRLSAPFFREAALAYGHPYWEGRAAAAEEGGGPVPTTDPADRLTSAHEGHEVLPDRGAVEAAWTALRNREGLRAVPGRSLRLVSRPVLDGERIAMAPHLATDPFPGGIRFAHGVVLPDLVREAPAHADVPSLYEACARRHPGLSLPAFLTALSTAFAAALLEHADEVALADRRAGRQDVPFPR